MDVTKKHAQERNYEDIRGNGTWKNGRYTKDYDKVKEQFIQVTNMKEVSLIFEDKLMKMTI